MLKPPYSAQHPSQRGELPWADGVQLAVWIVVNVEAFAVSVRTEGGVNLRPSGRRSPPEFGRRDYGARVGIWRIVDALQEFSMPATVAMNSAVVVEYPGLVEALVKLQWEFIGHNEWNDDRLTSMTAPEERRCIAASLSELAAATGRRPVGWLSSGLHSTVGTPPALLEEGVRYLGDWLGDDAPSILPTGVDGLVLLPYSLETNDRTAISLEHQESSAFADRCIRQFDVLYREGQRSPKVMALALHPFVMGVPHRIDDLRRILAHIASHENVWVSTGARISAAWVDHVSQLE